MLVRPGQGPILNRAPLRLFTGKQMDPAIDALIAHFGFTVLPSEGTLFASTWRSADSGAEGGPVGTAMIGMYCEQPPSRSRFHRLPVDEVWHFYAGDPLRLVLLFPDGSSREIRMGNDPLNGELVQCVVPAGVWQAGHLATGGRYALFGCTMAPGFTDRMYEGGLRELLLRTHPDRADDIAQLGCELGDTRMPAGFAT
jgi:predicted cupin superfamily sugar epimerase